MWLERLVGCYVRVSDAWRARRLRDEHIHGLRGVLVISESVYYNTRQEGLEIESCSWAGMVFRARERLSELGDYSWRKTDDN